MNDQTYSLYKISGLKDFSDDDLQYGLDLLEEADKVKSNAAIMKNLEEYGKKKAKVYASIADIRDASNEMALNPGKARTELSIEEEGMEKKAKRLSKV